MLKRSTLDTVDINSLRLEDIFVEIKVFTIANRSFSFRTKCRRFKRQFMFSISWKTWFLLHNLQ